MMDNDKDIDLATSGWLKKLSLDEPSENFSLKVMQSVLALNEENQKDKMNFWWLLLLVPVFGAAFWFLSTLPEFDGKFSFSLNFIREYYNSLNTGFGEIFGKIKTLTISPVVILIFLAVLSLLIIEDIFSKGRQKLKTES